MAMKVHEVIVILSDNGFAVDRQNGSHRQFEGYVNGQRRIVTVVGKPNDDIAPGTLGSIKRQSGLPKKLFRKG